MKTQPNYQKKFRFLRNIILFIGGGNILFATKVAVGVDFCYAVHC